MHLRFGRHELRIRRGIGAGLRLLILLWSHLVRNRATILHLRISLHGLLLVIAMGGVDVLRGGDEFVSDDDS